MQRAEFANRAKTGFLAPMSPELRTPGEGTMVNTTFPPEHTLSAA